jgi:hypothetical protein
MWQCFYRPPVNHPTTWDGGLGKKRSKLVMRGDGELLNGRIIALQPNDEIGARLPPVKLIAFFPRRPSVLARIAGATPSGWAKSCAVRRRSISAGFMVSPGRVRDMFRSRITPDKPDLKVRVQYIDRPFSRLENIWTQGLSRGRRLARRVFY